MGSLRRIILIHTHLPGVVELALDGHTNICGTNASGKTTLQRLVPVFYGELPSKVVPKTRKKFDDFYLPCDNSYLVYEYQREEGNICQVVLTSKAKEGVNYRLIEGAFSHDQLLVKDNQGKVNALSQELWLKQLKAAGITYSHKISATSEYRAIIQNDVSMIRGNSKDALKLRQLAGRYSLVSSRHRVRHIEKLVSAVHAKEGKMDTLKSMLAAIFEEDGLVQPTTRVKNTKAREWIKQIRQSMRLEGLQAEQDKIELLAQKLNDVELKLFQLRPVLNEDLGENTSQKADVEQNLGQLKQTLSRIKTEFNDRENTLNSRFSEVNAELEVISTRLDNIQQQYDGYLDGDIDQLLKDNENLPLWRENLQQQQEQYQILLEQYGDLEKQLNQQKITLNESLERLAQKNRNKIKAIESERESVRNSQLDKQSGLNDDYQKRSDELKLGFDQQLHQQQETMTRLLVQIDNVGPSKQEQEDGQLADTRLDYAQDKWREASKSKERAHREWQQARQVQDKAQTVLEQSRTFHHKARQELQQLEQMLNPEQGSLRHYLRTQLPGWESTLGKVIDQGLLGRSDLNPQLAPESGEGLFGVKLALAAVDAPEYAQDEMALQERLTQAQSRVEQARAEQEQAEKALTASHEQVKQLQDIAGQNQRQLDDADQEVAYARESKSRLAQKHKEAIGARQSVSRQELAAAKERHQQICSQQKTSLAKLKEDHQEQLLEFKADWQEQIELFNEQIHELESQVDEKRDSNRTQIKQLEQAFNQELSSKDIDPNTLKQLQENIKTLKADISRVSGRQDELREYRSFISQEWQKQRPGYLEKEIALKSDAESLRLELDQHKSAYRSRQKEVESQRQQAQQLLQEYSAFISQLQPLVNKLAELDFTALAHGGDLSALEDGQGGDLSERLSRAHQGLEQSSKLSRELKERLNDFESQLTRDAQGQFLGLMESEFSRLEPGCDVRLKLPVFDGLLKILADQQRQILEQGETIGGDLHKFFTVFSDINRRIAGQSQRLTQAVADDLNLDGIKRSEVKIISTVDELNFWQPLKRFAALFDDWCLSGKQLPGDDYIDALSDVVDLLRSDASYSIESLLRLELHLNEAGTDLVIKNDRQLLESSSHGMAYLILCKFLLAFTRLLRGEANIVINWPIDEIGTLAYHNVEKLFSACDSNKIAIVGAFPNPESDVLTLFKHRYLIDKQKKRLQRIEPKLSRIAERLASQQPSQNSAGQVSKQQAQAAQVNQANTSPEVNA
ncbi:ATP-binding protein [Thalassomonas haliotis]|uniref:ATP-binding protein n=1 Tax=Thalassomonas haliotis TaxID=485448 RepID=A0ABY7V9F3_9GAMM|nr:ATP-binding protein [Thalassomonas haliotis]WDE09850.1 ATP-binding protein [Thalassomonas haliotis]